MFIYLFIYLSIYLFIYLSIYLGIVNSVPCTATWRCTAVHISIYLFRCCLLCTVYCDLEVYCCTYIYLSRCCLLCTVYCDLEVYCCTYIYLSRCCLLCTVYCDLEVYCCSETMLVMIWRWSGLKGGSTLFLKGIFSENFFSVFGLFSNVDKINI